MPSGGKGEEGGDEGEVMAGSVGVSGTAGAEEFRTSSPSQPVGAEEFGGSPPCCVTEVQTLGSVMGHSSQTCK
jgi:hypothetical protein